jgi:FAD/FMN-containing dehydrogenase
LTDLIERTLDRLGEQLSGGISRPGDDRYAAATAIWVKPVGPMPRAIAHCHTTQDVQAAIRTARDCDLPLSVRGGGHDPAGRALCEGLVIDLRGMNGVEAYLENCTARIGGGARAADVVKKTDPLGLAPVTGAVGAVGMTGLTLGGGYGPLIGRFGLALDNLLAAEVVLPDGRIVVAKPENESELFWALRGGGGNFGVVTMMHHRLHHLPSVRAGLLIYPFAEASTVLGGCTEIAASAPDALTVQIGIVAGPDGAPMVLVIPTWCGEPGEGEARVAPFLKLGTLLGGGVDTTPYGPWLSGFDPFLFDGRRTFMETCWVPALDSAAIDAMIQRVATVTSPLCAVFTHEFRGVASRVPLETTAFGLRRDHVLIEIMGAHTDPSIEFAEEHRQWALATRHAFDAIALPGGYPNLLAGDDPDREAKSYGPNAERLMRAKRHYDPDNVFRSTIPLPSSANHRSYLEYAAQ